MTDERHHFRNIVLLWLLTNIIMVPISKPEDDASTLPFYPEIPDERENPEENGENATQRQGPPMNTKEGRHCNNRLVLEC